MRQTSGRGSRARRSAVGWGIRGGLALLALMLGYVSVTHSLADVVKRGDPARAHALAPGDGRITALLAEKRFAQDPAPGARSPIARLALLALDQDATAVPAVATLGFQAQLRGEIARARQLFAYAQSLSRRHLQTQLWAIEEAVARGDVPGALRQYDEALRTSRAAPDLLFPVLSAAIADPTIRSGLVATMAERPAWASAFVNHVATARNDPRATVRFLADLARTGVPVPPAASARTIDRLIEADAVSDAWRYYAGSHPGADPSRSRDPRFIADSQAPSRFDWTPIDDPGIAASIQPAGNDGVFDFSVSSGVGGVLLKQVQVLPAGVYILKGHSLGIEQPEQSQPYWALTCDDGRELGRVVVSNSAQRDGQFAGRLVVPAGCPVQVLALIARASDQASGVVGRIDRVQLTPLRLSPKGDVDR